MEKEKGIGDLDERNGETWREGKNGGSLKLWRNYFKNATIYGLDILPVSRVLDEIVHDDKIILYNDIDAYDSNFVKNNFSSKNIKFDFILDDGPHTLESQKKFIELYLPLLESEGILIIEDILSISWFEELTSVTPEKFKPYIKTYDLRKNKNRWDDLVFVIDKLNY